MNRGTELGLPAARRHVCDYLTGDIDPEGPDRHVGILLAGVVHPDTVALRDERHRQPGAVLRSGNTRRARGAHVRGRVPTTDSRASCLGGNFLWRAARCHLLSLGARKSMKTWSR